jgi:hypothetical protein
MLSSCIECGCRGRCDEQAGDLGSSYRNVLARPADSRPADSRLFSCGEEWGYLPSRGDSIIWRRRNAGESQANMRLLEVQPPASIGSRHWCPRLMTRFSLSSSRKGIGGTPAGDPTVGVWILRCRSFGTDSSDAVKSNAVRSHKTTPINHDMWPMERVGEGKRT